MKTTFYPVPPNIHTLTYVLLAVSLFLLAWVFSNYRNQAFKIFRAAVSEQQKNNLIREDSESIKKVNRLLNIIFFINLILLLYSVNFRYNFFSIKSNSDIIIYSSLILILFALKTVFNLILAWVFNTKSLFLLYLKDNYMKLKLFSILSIISTFLILFSTKSYPFFIFISWFALVILWIIRCFKAYKYSMEYKSFSIVYAFLYICTLEILPIALLGNFLMGNN